MKKLLVILIILLICVPVIAQGDGGTTPPVETQSQYDSVFIALISVIGFLSTLVAFLGYKVSSLIPPELVALSLKLTDMTTSKTDDEKLLEYWKNQGYNIQKTNNVWIVTPPANNTTVSTASSTTTTTGSGTIEPVG